LSTSPPTDEQLIQQALASSGLTLPDSEHGRRAARFAGGLFDALRARLELAPDDRRLALLAALFHDVGYARDVREHQRKSFDMLREARLLDLTDAEREIVAAVTRYHRKSLPNIEHAGFGFMSTNDQRRVRRLSGVVRLAVALDASHLGVVQSIDVRPDSEPIVLTAHASGNVEVERDRLRENAAAFTHLTQLPLRAEFVVSRG
jgi:exopolyphosphatase/guanosine-5'-triphosphate,3'-diphosphate pyrophosphatase